MTLIIVNDATHANIQHLPAGPAAGYTTGSPDIKWTQNDWNNHPGAVRIDQDARASDFTADALDVENGAATAAECAAWFTKTIANFQKGARPGQRYPVIYVNGSNMHAVANALVNAGIHVPVPLWLANWSLSQAQVATDIDAASGPFPIMGVQFHNAGLYDVSLFSANWLNTVSKTPNPPVVNTVPPGQWDASKGHDWTWKSAMVSGVGLDGKTHSFQFNPATGQWVKSA